jgi:glutaredoxin
MILRSVMKKVFAWLSVATIGAAVFSVSAQGLYRWEDKDGRVTYSDTPPPKDAKQPQKKKLVDNIIEQEAVPFAVKDAMKKNPVTLYVTNCGEACTQARDLLTKRGIPFAERDPSQDAKAADALKSLVGGLDVPTMTVGENKFKGYLESSWSSALDSAGYPRTNATLKPAASARAAPVEPAKAAVK